MDRRKIALGAVLTALSLSAAPAGAQGATAPLPADVAALLPVASRCQVTALDSDSVRVTGAVDPNTLATSYRVEYGLLGILNLSSPTLEAGSSPDPSTIITQLDDLVPGGSYSCRIVALNSAGETAGSTTTFVVGGDDATGSPGSGGSDGSSGSNGSGSKGSDGTSGSGGTGATPSVNPASGLVVAAGTPGAVKCTLTGTAGRDRLKGTKRRDVICGLGGADRIIGLAGNDILIGGPGNDRMQGNGGKDRLLGNSGKDRLLGGTGSDTLSGGRGADYLFGWKGRDRMAGGAGNDRFVANRDRRSGDRLNGGSGRDRASLNRGDRMRSIERARVKRR
jgi:Ca2+-binding RTX toxin-like protein